MTDVGFGLGLAGLTVALIANTMVLTRIFRKVDLVHGEVKTANSLTLGALADNTEVRRILHIAAGERSTEESEHLDDVLRQSHQ
jgi:UDP-N-acetylglucosamine 2-epimerase